MSRAITLSDDPENHPGTSEFNRKREPLEIPLVAGGYLDDSVVGYWPLDEDAEDRNQEVAGARAFDGVNALDTGFVPQLGAGDSLTALAWARIDVIPDPEDAGFILGYQDQRTTPGGLLLGCTTDGNRPYARVCDEHDVRAVLAPEVPSVRCADGRWHHFGLVRDARARRLYLYLDGSLALALEDPTEGALNVPEQSVFLGARHMNGQAADGIAGAIDEVIILNRALSPLEVQHYYESRQPWGTPLLPGAQPDYDDVRVFEEDDQEVEFEVVGARPHSDTPCPMDEDDGTWANRHDLCGVVGYWPLDGDGRDVTGQHDGENHGGAATSGRFGDRNGALLFGGNEAQASVVVPAANEQVEVGDFTMEAWFRMDDYGRNSESRTYLVDARSPEGDSPPGAALVVDRQADGAFELHHSLYAGQPVTGYEVVAPIPLVLGRWHHTALQRRGQAVAVYFDGLAVPHEAVLLGDNPLPRPVPLVGQRIRIGAFRSGCERPGCFFMEGALDEVLIHSVAKSADYIYKRAHPLPRLRFLVNTEDVAGQGARYAYKPYELRWGNPDALLSEWVMPDGMLSPRNGYVGWWRFEEGSGSQAVDWTGNRNHGELDGPVVAGGAQGSGALLFDGGDDLLVVPDSLSLAPDSLTFEALLFVDDAEAGAASIVVDRLDCPAEQGYGLWIGGRERWTLAINDDVYRHNSDLAPTFDVWQHVAAAYDQPGRTTELWIDHASLGLQGGAPAVIHPATELYIGSARYGGNRGLNGRIDEVRIMNRALPPEELLHFPLSSWSVGEVEDSSGGDVCDWLVPQLPNPTDSDRDAVPDRVECLLAQDPLDPREPALFLYDGFERRGDLGGQPSGWEVLPGATADCARVAEDEPHVGIQALALDGSTPGCAANQHLAIEIPGLADRPHTVAVWFRDPGDAQGEIRLQLGALAGGSISGQEIGLIRDTDTDHYRLFAHTDSGNRAPTAASVERSPGWHLAVLRRSEGGEVSGEIDGVNLGSVAAVADPTHIGLHAAGLLVHYDDVVAFDHTAGRQ